MVSTSDRCGAWVCSSRVGIDVVNLQMLRTASNALRVKTDEQCWILSYAACFGSRGMVSGCLHTLCMSYILLDAVAALQHVPAEF